MPACPNRLIIAPVLRDQIFAAVLKRPDQERCGLLVGSGHSDITVESIFEAENMSPEPTHRFEIDPQAQFDLLRRLRGTPQRIVGHFHSHPNGPAAPSAFDLSMAHDPDAIWLIVALSPRPHLAAFACPDQSQGFQAIVVSPGP